MLTLAFFLLSPTAPCGPDFDKILDDKIGYLDFTVDQDTDVQQADGAWGDFFGTADASDSTTARRALARRAMSGALVKREDCAWYDAPCYARKLVQVIVQAPAAIAEKAKDLGTSLVNAAVDVGTGIYNGAKAAVSIVYTLKLRPQNADSRCASTMPSPTLPSTLPCLSALVLPTLTVPSAPLTVSTTPKLKRRTALKAHWTSTVLVAELPGAPTFTELLTIPSVCFIHFLTLQDSAD